MKNVEFEKDLFEDLILSDNELLVVKGGNFAYLAMAAGIDVVRVMVRDVLISV